MPSGDAVGECTGAGRIEWADAPDHVGTKIALFGPVDEVEQDQFFGEGGSALVVGYPEGDAELVDVFIPERVRDRFSGDLSTRYQGKVVCAVGVLQQADDQLVLVINQPQDIVLV